MNNETELAQKVLGDLKYDFEIPAYQRGYRWSEQQIKAFFNDLENEVQTWEKYFLQAIVIQKDKSVQQCETDEPCQKVQLIDGQQRLTTAWLLDGLLCEKASTLPFKLKRFDYKISYESRDHSYYFMQSLVDKNACNQCHMASDNIDYWYMAKAVEIMLLWLDKYNFNKIQCIHKKLHQQVFVLIYEDLDTDPRKKFESLNSGKIELSDAELCRSVLLWTDAHYSDPTVKEELAKSKKEDTQRLIASSWDKIERELHDKQFWGFLHGKEDEPVRMNYLFDIFNAHDNTIQKFPHFDKLFNKLKEKEKLSKVNDAFSEWQKIALIYEILQYWRKDRDYYHWIGYLCSLLPHRDNLESKNNVGKFLHELVNMAQNLDKDAFRKSLKNLAGRITISGGGDNFFKALQGNQEIQPVAPPDIGKLSYGVDDALLCRLFLLFNVEYARRSSHHDAKFPFDIHNQKDHSLEHLNAQNIDLNSMEVWQSWCQMTRDFVAKSNPDHKTDAKKNLLKKYDNLAESIQNNKGEWDESIKNKLDDLFREFENYAGDKTGNQDNIYNLVLIDNKLNSSLQNIPFSSKQQRIREKLVRPLDGAETFYIPIGTEAVIMRLFTDWGSDEPLWSQRDREGYEKAMHNILSFYWPTLKI